MSVRVHVLFPPFPPAAMQNRQTCVYVHARMCRHMQEHWDALLLNVAFPKLCFSDEDQALWADDPHEYIRKVHDGGQKLQHAASTQSPPGSQSCKPCPRAGLCRQRTHRLLCLPDWLCCRATTSWRTCTRPRPRWPTLHTTCARKSARTWTSSWQPWWHSCSSTWPPRPPQTMQACPWCVRARPQLLLCCMDARQACVLFTFPRVIGTGNSAVPETAKSM